MQSNETRKRLRILIVFAVLVLTRLTLWLAIEKWPDVAGKPVFGITAGTEDTIVKVKGLPVRLMIYWSDSGRYWITLSELSEYLKPVNSFYLSSAYFFTQGFFALVRSIHDSFAFAVLVLNIVGLMTAWLLSRMLANCSVIFIAAVLLMAFLNLFTIAMEYSIMREVLARFVLILGIFLMWRVRHSESWGLTLLAGMIMLCLGFFRQEMMVYPLAMATVFFTKSTRKKAIIFVAIGFLSIYGHKIMAPSQSTGKLQLTENLILETYNYISPDLGDLPRNIYEAGKKCEEKFLIKCQFPSFRESTFKLEQAKLIKEWMEKNPNSHVAEKTTDNYAIIFNDALKYNTKYVFYSIGYSMWSFLTGNLFTVSPFVYNGANPNFILGWPSYASTSLTGFADPLSELSLDVKKRGPTWLIALLSPFSEKWYRTICAPFFLTGLYCIAAMVIFNKFNMPEKEKTFWFLAALVCLPGFVIASLVGARTSRSVFTIDPLMIAISILGARIIWHKTAGRLVLSIKNS